MANKKETGSVNAVISLSEQEKKNKSKKVAVVITYVIAMLALWAGLFAPIFGDSNVLAEKMMFRYLPGIFNASLFDALGKKLIPDLGAWFLDYTPGPTVWGIDFLALFCVLYAVVSVLSVIFLIPVCCGNKNKRTSAGCAFFIEILAILSLLATAYMRLTQIGSLEDFGMLNILIPLGACVLMAVIQSIVRKGGLGVYKMFVFIIALLSVVALFDLAVFIPALETPLNDLSDLLKSGAIAGLVSFDGSAAYGYQYLELYTGLKAVFEISKITELITVVLLIAFTTMIVVNALVETIALGNGGKYRQNGTPVSNKGHNVFALVRYILTIVLGAAAIVLMIVSDYGKPGVYLYILLIITLVQLIFAIVRTAMDAKRVKNGALAIDDGKKVGAFDDDGDMIAAQPAEQQATPAVQPVVVTETVPVAVAETAAEPAEEPAEEIPPIVPIAPAVTEPVPVEPVPVYPAVSAETAESEPEQLSLLEGQKAPEPQPAPEERTMVYTYKAIYNGPTDDFINTLEDSEKIEFVQVFLEKSRGKVSGVPDYVIGGENADFFPAIFVHLNRFRNILSDGLIAKIYKQLC